MNRILAYDPELGTVRCEPGVTFRQLSAFLRSKGNDHFVSVTGGDPDSSVLGNILERGDGTGPYCERSKYACSLEVILADGSVIDTGYGNVAHSHLANLIETGLGPSFQDLFIQSNLGIVTKITLWLCPVPRFFRYYSFSQAEEHSFPHLLNTLRDLFRRRILRDPITFWNDYKQLSATMQYPFHLTNGQTPLARDVIKNISNNYSTWYAFGGIYVDDEHIGKRIMKELFKQIQPHTRKKNRWSQLSTRKIWWLHHLNRLPTRNRLTFDQLLQGWNHNPMLGYTSKSNVRSLYWRKKDPVPAEIDPNQQFCGVLWNSFVIPFRGEEIERVFAGLEAIILKHGFEPIVSFVILNDRYVKVFQQLIFDRAIPEEDQAALVCHNEVFEYLESAGCSHSRLDILHMKRGKELLVNDLLNDKIKHALDPDGILAPGRYF